jgi:predicted HTH transcriptional regulator
MSETNRIEYKQELTKEVNIEKEVVTFLNSKEGRAIYIGIDKFGLGYGVSDIDGDMLKIKDRLMSLTEVKILLQILAIYFHFNSLKKERLI